MTKFGDEGSGGKSAREHWENAPIDWGRVFRGEPFQGPKERPLHFPIRAEGRYASKPPEEIDQDTGEITPPSYWEIRSCADGVRSWMPVEAHRRAERREYWAFDSRVPNFQAVTDPRAGKD